jgi:hypothetical protein
LVADNPYRRKGFDAGPFATDSEEQTGADKDNLVIEQGSSSTEVPVWAWVAAVVAVFVLLVALLVTVIWCIRRRQFCSSVVRSSVFLMFEGLPPFQGCFVLTGISRGCLIVECTALFLIQNTTSISW